MSFDLRNCDQVCSECVRSYGKKHKVGNQYRPFEIKCTGIPKQYIPDHILSTFSSELNNTDPNMALAALDPVVWASQFLDWHCIDPDGSIWIRKTSNGSLGGLPDFNPETDTEKIRKGKSIFNRPYQATMLRCSSKRKVFLIGRQAGKTETLCISILYSIFTHNNFSVEVIAPYQSQVDLIFVRLMSLIRSNVNLNNSVSRHVKAPNYTLELHNGSVVRGFTAASRSGGDAGASRGQHANMLVFDECFVANTLILTPTGEHQINTLSSGDLIYSFDKSGNTTIDQVVEKRMTGYKDTTLYLLETNESLQATPNHPVFDGKNFKPIDDMDFLLTKVPGRNLQPKVIDAALYAMLLTDGWATIDSRGNKLLGFSGSINGLEEIKEDLDIILPGVHSGKIYTRITISPDYGITGQTNHIMAGKVLWERLEKFGFPIGKKVSQGYKISDLIMNASKEEKRAFLATTFAAEGDKPGVQKNGKSFRTISITFTKETNLEYNLLNLLEQFKILLNEFGIESIIKKYNGKIRTPNRVKYELRLKNNKSNLCNFFNEISYRYDPKKTTLAFQFLTYLKIYSKGRGHKQKMPTITSFIKERMVGNFLKLYITSKTPNGILPVYNIKVKNNNTFFANRVAVHNCDYLNSADIDAALAVIINHPDATVWMSSTPTGKRQSFYDTCNDPLFKLFHFPSSVNPNWNEDMEKFFKSRYTSMGYIHEILAEFGEQEEGVYQIKYIEEAQVNYNINEQKHTDGWIYCMGVDWNDVKIGTTICVVGWCPGDRRFYLVDKQTVQRDGWNQLAAVEKVMEMNRVWRPDWIYIDLGYGHVQNELLHKLGQDAIKDKKRGPTHLDARLAKIVKGYDFGSSIEVKDPFTRELVKKPAKSFLVESSVRLFEAGSIKIPADDIKLKKALLGYKIKRVNQSGMPIYEQSDENAGDHELDAMNLAIVAFVLEKSEFGTTNKYSSYITHISANLIEIAEQTEKKEGPISRTNYENNKVPAAHTTRNLLGKPRIYSKEAWLTDAPSGNTSKSQPTQRKFLGRRLMKPRRKMF